MTADMEKLWIQLVKENNDSTALVNLVRRYQPMINKMRLQYFISGYEAMDWYQEALLVCYQTCFVFNGDSGSKFGSFFKMKYKNHVIDIIRRENAQKRKANIGTKPLEMVPVEDQKDIGAIENCERLELQSQIQNIITNFSNLELLSFQFLLGKLSKEEACRRANCDLKQIERAIKRSELKIKCRDAREILL